MARGRQPSEGQPPEDEGLPRNQGPQLSPELEAQIAAIVERRSAELIAERIQAMTGGKSFTELFAEAVNSQMVAIRDQVARDMDAIKGAAQAVASQPPSHNGHGPNGGGGGGQNGPPPGPGDPGSESAGVPAPMSGGGIAGAALEYVKGNPLAALDWLLDQVFKRFEQSVDTYQKFTLAKLQATNPFMQAEVLRSQWPQVFAMYTPSPWGPEQLKIMSESYGAGVRTKNSGALTLLDELQKRGVWPNGSTSPSPSSGEPGSVSSPGTPGSATVPPPSQTIPGMPTTTTTPSPQTPPLGDTTWHPDPTPQPAPVRQGRAPSRMRAL